MLHCGKSLFSFQRRISRKAFWLYVLAVFVINLVVAFLAPTVVITETDPNAAMAAAFTATPWWSWLISLVLFVVGLAVLAKRWHDQDRSGWWTLLGLIPILGGLIVLIMCGFIPGTPGSNRFGEGPMA